MKLEGMPFKNSPVCEGVGYVEEGAGADIAKIELTGRYPEHGWVMNEINYEVAYISKGGGQFITSDRKTIFVQEGDAISINAGTKYAWNGTMTMIVACNPPYDPAQHKILEEN